MDADDMVGFGQHLKVASLGCRIAAAIDDTFRANRQQAGDCFLSQTDAGRIDDNHVRLTVPANPIAIEDLRYVSLAKDTILYLIQLGVFGGQSNRIRVILNADDSLRISSQEKGDCTQTRV